MTPTRKSVPGAGSEAALFLIIKWPHQVIFQEEALLHRAYCYACGWNDCDYNLGELQARAASSHDLRQEG